jgi:hypothetical protein
MTFYQDHAFIDAVRTHFVSLTVHCTPVTASGDRAGEDVIAAYSAFVIDIFGVWCLVSAGHVISDSETGIEKKPTPFTYQEHQKIHVDRDGIDICLIPLRDFYRDSLKANGIAPIPCVMWDQSVPECDEYALLGAPMETTRPIAETERRGPGLSVLLAMVPLEPRPLPAERVLSTAPRFCGELLDGGELKSVKGMSGGPILGIRHSGTNIVRSYSCLAVQSSWHEPSRLVFGTPVGMIVHFVKTELIRSLSESKSA